MASTTNYSWTTPDDTSLVKDGASAIRTLGSSVDTTVKNLNPETTLGDISYRSSTANVNTRLPLGTANQQLRVNSGATAPEWFTPAASGGMTLISTTTMSGATVNLTSIAGTYKHLLIVIAGMTNATASGYLQLQPNGANNSSTQSIDAGNNTSTVSSYTGSSQIYLNTNTAILNTSTKNAAEIWIYNYASATQPKKVTTHLMYTGGSNERAAYTQGIINTTSAITSLLFTNSGGNFSTGELLLYGVS